jgi:signal transduction histidine kinase
MTSVLAGATGAARRHRNQGDELGRSLPGGNARSVSGLQPPLREARARHPAARLGVALEMRGLPSPREAHMSQTVAMPVGAQLVWELATAADIDIGMARVVELLRRACGATRVEWWKPDEDDELTLFASDGPGGGDVRRFGLGPAGELVVCGCRDPRLTSALAGAMPVLRRRCVEERLTRAAMDLARRNEALEEFAALVAHELKAPLHAALVADDASGELVQALERGDSLLEAARAGCDSPVASVAACLEQALEDLGAIGVEVTAALTAVLPLPSTSLRVILRNLIRNAVAAGARHRRRLRSGSGSAGSPAATSRAAGGQPSASP